MAGRVRRRNLRYGYRDFWENARCTVRSHERECDVHRVVSGEPSRAGWFGGSEQKDLGRGRNDTVSLVDHSSRKVSRDFLRLVAEAEVARVCLKTVTTDIVRGINDVTSLNIFCHHFFRHRDRISRRADERDFSSTRWEAAEDDSAGALQKGVTGIKRNTAGKPVTLYDDSHSPY